MGGRLHPSGHFTRSPGGATVDSPMRVRLSSSGIRVLTAIALLAAVLAFGSSSRASHGNAGTRNGAIVFDTEWGSGPSQIYTIRADGSGLRQLTSVGDGQAAFQPRWSADGRMIVYVSDESGNPEIYLIKANGTGKVQLTNDPGFANFWPTFAPNGSQIAFSRCSSFLGTCDLAVMRTDGSQIRSLVGGYWHHGQPAYSPDGTNIAYTSDEGGYDSLLWVAKADGSGRQAVSPAPLAADRPDWSPDGGTITYTGNPRAGQIFVSRPDGSHLRAITSTDAGVLFGTYSPDGTKMVGRGDPAGLFLMNPDGSGIAPIANAPEGATFPDWGVAQ
jgi:Tol biopolymer transport system component